MHVTESLAVMIGLVATGVAAAAGAQIAIYPDVNYGGTPQQFHTDADNKCWAVAPSYDNKISSFRVVLDPNVFCYFYDGSDCNSANELFSVLTNWNNPNLGGANDKISSFKCQ